MASYAEIREWAWANNYDVAATGRIAAEVVEAYEAAHTTRLDQAGVEPVELQPVDAGTRQASVDTVEPDAPPSGDDATDPVAMDASPPPAVRRGRSRLPGVIYLPGRGKVQLKHDRPGEPG